jgi:hypothetical protein
MKPTPESSAQEVLAGLVERITFHNEENGFCVLRTKARGHRDLVTVVGRAVSISAGEWITASGEWVNCLDCDLLVFDEASMVDVLLMQALLKGVGAQMAAIHAASMTMARGLAQVQTLVQQDSAERALNKLARTFAAQVEALKNYRSKGEQKVQQVHVAEGGQAIVGNVTAPTEGVGARKSRRIDPMLLHMRRALRCSATSKRSGKPCESPAVRGHSVCRMHGAGGGGRKGNRNALRHGLYTSEAVDERRMVAALTKQARELVEMV